MHLRPRLDELAERLHKRELRRAFLGVNQRPKLRVDRWLARFAAVQAEHWLGFAVVKRQKRARPQ